MKSLKTIAALGIDLLILFAALAFIFHNFIIGFDEGGDVVFLTWIYFGVIFLTNSVFYTALRFLLDRKQRAFLQNLLVVLLVTSLLGIAAFAVVSSTGQGKRIAILFLLPFALLGLRHLFLKFLALKK